MTGILPMAVITVLFSAFSCAVMLGIFSGRKGRYLWLLLVGLPLSLVVNRWVKTPVLNWVAGAAGIPLSINGVPLWFLALVLFNSPIWEEAIKALPLLLPGLRRFLADPLDALWAGLALGMSFGLGEAIFIAYGISQSPQYAGMPWYYFTGYAGERIVITFAHGLMTSLVALGLSQGGRGLLRGYFTAVLLHALINIGALLIGLRLIDALVASLLMYAGVFLAAWLFYRAMQKYRRPTAPQPLPNEQVLYEKGEG